MHPKKILQELNRYKIGTCAEMIYRNALFYPDRETFIFGQTRRTFAEFNSRVNCLVNGLLSMGLKKGDVVGVLAWNSIEYLEVYGAAMKGGFIISPFNPRLNERELKYLVDYSTAKILFVGQELRDMAQKLTSAESCAVKCISLGFSDQLMISYDSLMTEFPESEPNVRTEENDPIFIVYTSGTTGVPRGAVYTHQRFIEDIKTYVMMTGIQPEDKFVMIMPLFHIGGAKIFWGYFYVGASHVLLKFFQPEETLRAVEEERATDLHIVPTHLSAFFSIPDFKKYDLTSLKRMLYAASPMPLQLLKQGIDTWGQIFIQEYGSTETGPSVCFLRIEDHKALGRSDEDEKTLMSCGRPNLGVHVRIVDAADEDVEPYEVGEIIVQGNTMNEFWRKPLDTAEQLKNGWVYTGDLGHYDDRGYIYIVDRKKDMIISGGENVFPREIEEILYKHPSVKEAAVIGVPDDYWVERVHAVIALKEGSCATADELIAYCTKMVARYKAPKSIEFMDSLPKNPAGKILKKDLREKYRPNRRQNDI